MDDTTWNDTYGEITRAQLAKMKANAKMCSRCGMLATVDPVQHATRYAHAPEYRDGGFRQIWNGARFADEREWPEVPPDPDEDDQ